MPCLEDYSHLNHSSLQCSNSSLMIPYQPRILHQQRHAVATIVRRVVNVVTHAGLDGHADDTNHVCIFLVPLGRRPCQRGPAGPAVVDIGASNEHLSVVVGNPSRPSAVKGWNKLKRPAGRPVRDTVVRRNVNAHSHQRVREHVWLRPVRYNDLPIRSSEDATWSKKLACWHKNICVALGGDLFEQVDAGSLNWMILRLKMVFAPLGRYPADGWSR